MNYKQLRDLSHNNLLHIRSLDRLIQSELFETAYENASTQEHCIVRSIIKQQSVERLKWWIKYHTTTEFAELTVRELRGIAQNNGIPGYHRLDKATLLRELGEIHERKNIRITQSNEDAHT